MGAFEAVLTPGGCLDKSPQFSWTGVVCLCLLPWAERGELAQGHSAGFVTRMGLELKSPQILAQGFNHDTKVAFFLLSYLPDKAKAAVHRSV